MKWSTVFAVATALFVTGTAGAQNSGKAPNADAKRMQQLAQDNMAEIEAGKVAVQKAQDPKVKEFAQKMVDDHTKLLDDLQKLAQSKNVDLPTAPDAKHEKALQKLQSQSGPKFDREYMKAMVKDHRQALKLVQRTAKSAKDADLKASAEQAAPEIQDHLKMAQDLAKGEKRSASGQTRESAQAGAR
jgi:putative membrane protein